MVFRFMICYLIKAIEFEWNLNLNPKIIVFKLERWSLNKLLIFKHIGL